MAISATSWKFTTGSSSTATVSAKSPAANDEDVAIDTEISFKFSKDMYESSVNETNIYLKRSSSTSKVAISLDYDSDTRVVTITPDDDLDLDTDYTVTITESVKDDDREAITPVTWKFTTTAEDNLRITDRNPDSADTGVSLSSKVTIKFSDALKSSSVTTSTFYLRSASSSKNVPASVSYSSSSKTVTITPDDPCSATPSIRFTSPAASRTAAALLFSHQLEIQNKS